MQEKNERTMKENYEAITQILNENKKKIIEIEEAIQNIKEIHRVVIPILAAFEKPEFKTKVEVVETEYSRGAIFAYEMSLIRQITFSQEPIVSVGNEQKIQDWLDKYSPVKLRVENIESKSYPYGEKVITVSLV